MSRDTERWLVVGNVLLIAAVAYALLQPSGVLGSRIQEWRRNRAFHARLADEWKNLIAEGGRLDAGGGRVALVEFSDYQCPYCRKAHQELVAFLSKHPDVGVVYRHFPLAIHPLAVRAALASICAEQQGRFQDLHRRLFETTDWQQDTNWVNEARRASVPDLRRFRACLTSGEATRRLDADRAIGDKVDVTGTPAFFGPTVVAHGVQSEEALARLTAPKDPDEF